MKSTIFLSVAIFLMSHFISSGQTLVNKEWDFNTGNPIVSKWAKSITTANNELITVGNTFVSGEGTNMFLSKYLSDGTIGWQINFNSLASANDYGIDLTLDNSGNIYVCGTTDNNTTSNHDVLLLKFNSQGGLLWNISFNSTFSLNDIPTAVKTDNFGNVFLSVNSESNTTFSDYLLLKYNSLGVLVWEQRYDFAGLTDFPIGLEFDSAGNVLLVGASASNLTNWDFTTVKYSTSGSFLGELRNTLGGSGFDEPLDYKKDLNNNFYIVGKGSTDGINYNIKLVKISSAFALEWVRDIEGYGKNDAGTTVDVDDAGNVIIAGYKTKSNNIKELFVSKFNAIGIEQWEHHQTSKIETADAEVQSIDVNNIGEVYALSKEVGKSQSDDILLSKFDINGNTVFEKVLNTNANEEPKDIKITNDGNLYITALKSLLSSSGATLKTYETVKYSEYQQDPNVVFNADGVPLYKKNELIVRFDTSVVNRAAIDNQIGTAQKEFGDLNYFLEPNAATTIQNILAPLCPNSDKDVQSSAGCPIKVVKIFKQLKTTLTTTTSRLGETIKVPNFWATLLLVLPDGMDVQAVQNSLRSLNEIIVYTELNVIPKFTSGANDNIYSQQHSLESTVYPDGDINMEAAWDIIPSGGRQDIKCGVFDTGIRWTHRDFGYDGVNPNSSKVVDGWDMAHDVPLKSGLGDNHGDGHRELNGGYYRCNQK